MKTLMLMRHGKSSWDDQDQADFDRPLNARGRRDAPRMGQWLYRNNFLPQLIVASAAQRARTTATAVAQAMNYHGTVHFDEALYHATPGQIIELIHGLPDQYDRLLVIGHNPGLEQLASALTGQPQSLPTAAVAVIELPIDTWLDLQVNTPGQLVAMGRPKELEEQ